ncbi:unnamed protein product, partial [Ectocarpus sp. 12 AP-2014]
MDVFRRRKKRESSIIKLSRRWCACKMRRNILARDNAVKPEVTNTRTAVTTRMPWTDGSHVCHVFARLRSARLFGKERDTQASTPAQIAASIALCSRVCTGTNDVSLETRRIIYREAHLVEIR